MGLKLGRIDHRREPQCSPSPAHPKRIDGARDAQAARRRHHHRAIGRSALVQARVQEEAVHKRRLTPDQFVLACAVAFGLTVVVVLAVAVTHRPARPAPALIVDQPAPVALVELPAIKGDLESMPLRAIPEAPKAPIPAPAASTVASAAPTDLQAVREEPAAAPPDPRPSVTHRASGDICARYHGRRVETDGGRRWHCVFDKR
jgi:hypothetical protein